jgi:hypothetical protein
MKVLLTVTGHRPPHRSQSSALGPTQTQTTILTLMLTLTLTLNLHQIRMLASHRHI